MTNRYMPTTIVIICLTFVAYYFQIRDSNITLIFGLNINFLLGFFWQPLTSMFMHGGLMHIFMNMIVLLQFGSVIENARGRLYFVLLYFIGGILTSLLTLIYIYYFNPYSNVIGASGAICVLIGWIAKKDPFNRKGLIAAILLISFAPLLLGLNVAWFAHIFGFVIGYLIAKFIR